MESSFPGEAVDLPAPLARGWVALRPVDELPPPVRHATGYALFADRVAAAGDDVQALAVDVEALVTYLRDHRAALVAGGDPLLDSAGIFLGNALVARVADAEWQVFQVGSPEVAQGHGVSFVVLRLVRALLEADEGRLAEFAGILHRWDVHDAEEEEAERRLALRHDLRIPAVAFSRPADRRAVAVLDALVSYLTTHYRVTAEEAPVRPDDPSVDDVPTVRTIRMHPATAEATPLVIAIDATGAVIVRAGALQELPFFDPTVDELETTLLAVAAGAYREAYPLGVDRSAGYRLGSIDGATGSSGRGSVGHLPEARRAAAAARLAALPDGWTPWPLRAG